MFFRILYLIFIRCTSIHYYNFLKETEEIENLPYNWKKKENLHYFQKSLDKSK